MYFPSIKLHQSISYLINQPIYLPVYLFGINLSIREMKKKSLTYLFICLSVYLPVNASTHVSHVVTAQYINLMNQFYLNVCLFT